MDTRRMLTCTVLLVAAGLVGCAKKDGGDQWLAGGNGEVGATSPVSILKQIRGNDAGFTRPGVHLVHSQADLEALGSQDLIKQGIDFDTQCVVVLALGTQRTGGYWAHINGIQQEGDILYVQGIANRPAADAMTIQVLTQPYAAAVIEKAHAKVVRSAIASTEGAEPPSLITQEPPVHDAPDPDDAPATATEPATQPAASAAPEVDKPTGPASLGASD